MIWQLIDAKPRWYFTGFPKAGLRSARRTPHAP